MTNVITDFIFYESDLSNAERILGKDEQPALDYTIISVVILTLCIVLVVEVVRHRLDVAVHGNPFYQNVLELMYRELTTLGLVEFFIYLLHKYYKDFNLKMEVSFVALNTFEQIVCGVMDGITVLFVDVHFMLFYTAIFNAIQSAIVRLITTRRTDKAWIQTEDIEIKNYVAIRKEFERVDLEYRQLRTKMQSTKNTTTDSTTNSIIDTDTLDRILSLNWFVKKIHHLVIEFRHPRLTRRRRELLVPIRYHELRAHFIEQNRLHQNFKVSHYLKRSLTSVLLDFVQISSNTWILMMFSCNVFYFLCGIILGVSKSSEKVNNFLFAVTITLLTLFLVVAFVVFLKMRKIFEKILHMKLTIENTEGIECTWKGFSALKSEMKSYDQLTLFWGNNPRVIIHLTHFMNFGYALALAICFTFWKEFHGTTNWIIFVAIISYVVFLHLLADILPWFTLCTSMGQLVNKERLHETLAKMKLAEETMRVQRMSEERKVEREILSRQNEATKKSYSENEITSKQTCQTEMPSKIQSDELQAEDILTNESGEDRRVNILPFNTNHSSRYPQRKKTLSDGVLSMSKRGGNTKSKFDPMLFKTEISSLKREEKLHCTIGHDSSTKNKELSDIRMIETVLPQASSIGGFLDLPSERLDKLTSAPNMIHSELHYNNALEERLQRRKKLKSKSEGVLFMQASLTNAFPGVTSIPPFMIDKGRPKSNLETMSKLAQMSTKDLPDIPPFGQKLCAKNERNTKFDGFVSMRPEPFLHAKFGVGSVEFATNELTRSNRRHMRKKSHSDGVQLMSKLELSSEDIKNTFLPRLSNAATALLEDMSEVQSISKVDSQRIKVNSKSDLREPLTTISELMQRRQPKFRMKSKSEGVAFMRAPFIGITNEAGIKAASIERSKSEMRSESKLQSISELAQTCREDFPRDFEDAEGKNNNLTHLSVSKDNPFIHTELTENDDTIFTEDTVDLKKNQLEEANAKAYSDHFKEKSLNISIIENVAPSAISDNFSHCKNHTEELISVCSIDTIDHDSDIHDVPSVRQIQGHAAYVSSSKNPETSFLSRNLFSFFQSSVYKTISFLFGPMIALFFVGRVEGFNISSGTLVDYSNTFQLPLSITFWLELAWYCFMILDLFIAHTLMRKQRNIGVLSILWGLVINSLCLLLLIVAETKRCCSNDDASSIRYLALEEQHDSSYENVGCCPSFGSRTYGGIGPIEPFTSLIALSSLRYIFAEIVESYFGISTSTVSHDQSNHENEKHHSHYSTKKVCDLWLTAIGLHYDIAKKYGFFSCPILYCMLGIVLPEDESLVSNTFAVSNSVENKLIETKNKTGLSVLSGDLPKLGEDSLDEAVMPSVNTDFAIDDQFDCPWSKIIRQIRRCERKFLPLLDDWVLVDVVLTSHELIILDVLDDENSVDQTLLINELPHGGKGLHLRDIAKGRKIVSKFLINDIDFVGIEHRQAIPKDDELEDIEKNSEVQLEFMLEGHYPVHHYNSVEMTKRWTHVNEDRLKIHFTSGCGTLYLRFLDDLKEMEINGKINGLSDLLSSIGSQTKLWCRTIARLQGALNLKMNLPHFGETKETEELEDFIEICKRDPMEVERRIMRTLSMIQVSFKLDTMHQSIRSIH